MATKVRLDNVKLAFVHFDELQYHETDTEKKNGKYTCKGIVAAGTPDAEAIVKAARAEASEFFGGAEKAKALLRANKLKMPTKPGAECVNSDGELYKGIEETDITFNMSFYNPLVFFDQCKQKFASDGGLLKQNASGQLVPAPNGAKTSDVFYSGCICYMVVTCHGYDSGGGKGVRIQIEAVMKRADGENLSGGVQVDPEDAFADVEAEEPTIPTATESTTSTDEEW